MTPAHRLALAALAAAAPALAQTDMLPDIVVPENWLYDNYEQISGGRTYLRLSNGTANIGVGPLHVYGGASNGDGTQQVIQRIYKSNGTFTDRLASSFVYHPTHGHIHVENWAAYRLRSVLPGNGIGPIVAEGQKTSFCILDLGVYDNTLPGFKPQGQFNSCGSTTQGLSVGWQDIYSSGLDGQEIDITGLPAGQYWLESMVDPDNAFVESNEDNNSTFILVTIGGSGGGGNLTPDAFEPNDSSAETLSRTVGAINSPNLGPVGPERVISGLTIHDGSDDDFFRFYIPATGTNNDFVRINFLHSQGDIDMRLLNNAGTQIDISQGTGNSEQISLNNRAAGWYTLHVYGYNGDTTPDYDLTINPSANNPPTVTTLNPPAGDTRVLHAVDQYTVTFTASDPNNNTLWTTVYANTSPTLDGTEILLPTSINQPASLGSYVVNSAELAPDTYYFYVQVTDGGSVTGDWSTGTVTFYVPCPADLTGNGSLDVFDILEFFNQFGAANLNVDYTLDGTLNIFDILAFFTAFGSGC